MNSTTYKEVCSLYEQLMAGWNKRSADAMADLFAEEGELIGFDGSQVAGKAEIFLHLRPIFEQHPTPPFTVIIRRVVLLSSEVAILRAVAGMKPSENGDIDPKLNTHQTLIAVKLEGAWRIELFQNTPAQFHGRPDLVEQMTEELRLV